MGPPAVAVTRGRFPRFGTMALLKFLFGFKLRLWNTEAYDIRSGLGSSESNGPWPFILRALKCPGGSLPDRVNGQNCKLVL